MADSEDPEKHKPHRSAHSGRKAEKKAAKHTHVQEMTAKQRNPKAFAVQSSRKAERRFRRTMDIKSKGYHVPTVDRTPLKPPPAVIAVVGPPKVGKSTLLRCMVKNFTRQNISSIKGPVTVVSGKKKRITLIECNSDINQMIDIAKIADMVLLLIDAKSGLEMETFEFLNVCHVHGMPRVMGVLTHLDLFKNKKALQKTKTALKKRYQTEFPRGEKMFYLSGILHGDYLKNEVHNLCRFVSVMKFQPSSWKKSHPYVLADRIEDITDPDLVAKDPNCNRRVCLYGYARGGHLKKNCYYHIPGCGDHFVKHLHFLPDPCPLPEKRKKRSLNEKERLIYAPLSGIGGVVYDKDAVYIELKGSHSHAHRPEDGDMQSGNLLSTLIGSQQPVDEKMSSVQLSLFSGAAPLDSSGALEHNIITEENSIQVDASDSDSSDDTCEAEFEAQENCTFFGSSSESEGSQSEMEDHCSRGRKRKKVMPSCDDYVSFNEEVSEEGRSHVRSQKRRKKNNEEVISDDSEEQGCNLKWKEELGQKAADAFYRRQQESVNLQKIVYGQDTQLKLHNESRSNSGCDIGGLFYIPKKIQSEENINEFDCTKFIAEVPRNWGKEEEVDIIKDCFVTGTWTADEDADNLLKDDDELYGDFEDLELQNSETMHMDQNTESNSGSEKEQSEETATDEKTLQERRLEKKRKLKELFNAQFDEQEGRSYHDDLKLEADEQGELNKKEFENVDDEIRVQYEGYRPGLYLRLEIENMPCEFIKNFDPAYPIIVGALLSGENKMGYIQVRMRKHRWYPKILKTRDPLIISLGWKRFQTIPLFYVTDHNGRNRLLKYTPKHLHCMASFWGPVTPQKSGFCAVQTVSEISNDFRIAAIGAVTEVNQSTEIVKKLKLIGTPFEIFRKTAFIEGMFHSPLEVAKYEGAIIRTVSGIRGQIKKALRKPPGIFRATFEDKILMSDIVFLRTWVKVEVPQFCTPVCTLLLPPEQKMKWQGMKTLGRLRYEKGIHAPKSEDSLYTPIERKLRYVAPLLVPKNIQKELPFQDKIIHLPKSPTNSENQRVAVVREPHEREIAKAIKMLKTVHKLKTIKERRAIRARVKAFKKEKHKEEELRHRKLQEKKKHVMKYKNTQKPISSA